ncbi:MAG: 5'-nucleotidase C-terminal domain-containing protein, partial [Actinomycetota bacterium]
MTKPAPRSRARSRISALVAAFGLLAALLVASPGVATGQEATNTIMEIQGDAHLSPLAGETVTTTGVVTAVAFTGFYLQDPDGDGDDGTSDGIFIDSFRPAVEVGDEVSVTGAVEENIPGGPDTGNLSITQIDGDFTILSSGNALPDPVEIGRNGRRPGTDIVISDSELPTNLQTDPAVFNPDVDAIDFWETLEGMYVEVDRPAAVSATRQFSSFSSEFFSVPSNGATVSPKSARSNRGGILTQPDPDNLGDQNPERVQIQFDGTIYPGDVPAIKVGDKLDDVVGVVGYSFGNFEVNASEEVRVRPGNTPEQKSRLRPTGSQVTVASYNVLNLSPDASDDAQRDKIADQIVDQLRSPDVIALQEIQDNSGETDDGTTAADQTLQALVDAIAAAGGPVYESFDVAPPDGAFGGIPGGNIRNAFLYNPDRVDLLDFELLSQALLDELGIANSDAFTDSRSPLAAVFSFRGRPFTVVNNHMTSRFGSTPIFGGVQPFIQAGEADRAAQAQVLNDYVDLIRQGNRNPAIMVVGDLNTFEWTDDLAQILPGTNRVLTNLLTRSALEVNDRKNRYTFIFDGNSQALDHFFVTRPLLASAQLDIVHTNVDYPRTFDTVTASDHEPLLGRFRLPNSSGPTDLPGLTPSGLRLQVLHASDLEGGVDALDRAPNFAAIVDALEDSTDVDASVTISAGDNYIPGPFFGASGDGSLRPVFQSVYQQLFGRTDLTNIRESSGRGDITIMNIIGFDASAIGNHEFDAGSDAFESIIEEDVRGATPGDLRWTGAAFPYLSANLDFSADPDLGNLFTSDVLENTAFAPGPDELLAGANPPKIAPSTFITVDGGERIGVIGATTQLLQSISSPSGTTVIGPTSNDMPALAAVLQSEVDALESMGINKIILTSHLQQLALEEELATLLDGVDVIIAGGSDSLLANADDPLRSGDVADREYPVMATDAGGDPVAIVSTDGEYSYVGRLVVDFDPDGVLSETIDLAVNGPIKTEDPEVIDLWGSVGASQAAGTKAGLVAELVTAIDGVVEAKDGTVYGETSVYLDGRRESVRTEETNFGNLSADANLAEARAFDSTVVLSIKNGGGIRAPIGEIDGAGNLLPPQGNPSVGKDAGQISQLDLENTLRFNNGLTLLTLTAEELLAVLEHAVAATEPGATPGQFAQIGGARFSYDPSQAAGSRIVDAFLIDDSGADVTQLVSGGSLAVAADTT